MAALRSLSVERLLANYCAEQRFQFLVDGVQEPAIRVLSPESFLPVVVMEAEMAAYELLASGFRRIGLDQLPPVFPMGSKLVPDDESMFGVYARVRPIMGDGLGSLKATVFSLAMLRVFGVGQVQQCECSRIFERYALEKPISRQIDALNLGGSSWQPASLK